MLYAYLHSDIFLTDIMGYDWLKFSQIYTPKMLLSTPLFLTKWSVSAFRYVRFDFAASQVLQFYV